MPRHEGAFDANPCNSPQRPPNSAPLGDLSSPKISSLFALELAVAQLKAGECLEIWTAKSKGYAPVKADDPQITQSQGTHEPIGEFCWHLGVTQLKPYGGFRTEQSFLNEVDSQLRLPPPPDVRQPRSPLPNAKLSQDYPADWRGSESLAEVVDPGVDAIKNSLASLPLLTSGAAGMPGMLKSCRAHQECWRQRDAAEGNTSNSLRLWDDIRPDLTASIRFLPQHVAPLLSGSADPHRAIELQVVHYCVSFFLFSQPEPVSESFLNTNNVIGLSAGEADRSIDNTSVGFWRTLEPRRLASYYYFSREEAEFYNRQVFSKSEVLPAIRGSFTAFARGIASSIPAYGLVKTFGTGGEAATYLGPIGRFHVRNVTHPLKWILDDYRRITDLDRKQVYLDLEDPEVKRTIRRLKSSKGRSEALFEETESVCQDVWPKPCLQYRYLHETDHPIRTCRPPVYNDEEFRRICSASEYLLETFLSSDLDVQGPRKGSKAYKHMLEVGILLMCSGETPEIVIAGLLHDLYELYTVNRPQRLEEVTQQIREKFGAGVDELLVAVTEPAKTPKDFFPRKTSIIDKLESLADPLGIKVARILCASKLSTLQDGIRYIYEKGTTKGWSEGTWAQNFALYSFYLSIFERYQVSESLLINYRSQLVTFASWAHTFNATQDLSELRVSLGDYIACLIKSNNPE